MPDAILIPEDALHRIAVEMVVAAGADPTDARTVADHLVAANLAGHDSHGVGMLPLYLRAARAGLLAPRAHAALDPGEGAILGVDGRRGFGQVVARQAMAAGIERARSGGVAVVALRNAFHVGRVGAYGEQVAAAGLVSVHFVNVVGHAPVVAPFGGSDARLLTNPICVAIPGSAEDAPLLLDFATSAVALGKVRVAMNRGEAVQAGVLVDALGRPTTDPRVLYSEPRGAILPFGLHKGYGLGVVCELLAGVLSGGGTCFSSAFTADRVENNMLSILLDPGRLPGGAGLGAALAAVVGHVKASRPADPTAPVLVAGEPERATRRLRQSGGIPVERATWEELGAAAATVGVTLPQLA